MQWLWRSRLWLFFLIAHGLIVLRQPILWLFCLIAISRMDTLSYDNRSYRFIAFSFTDVSSHDNRSYRFTAISTWHPQSSLCPMAPWSYGLTVCIMILHSHNGITNDQGLRTRPTLPHTYMSYHIYTYTYHPTVYICTLYHTTMCTCAHTSALVRRGWKLYTNLPTIQCVSSIR